MKIPELVISFRFLACFRVKITIGSQMTATELQSRFARQAGASCVAVIFTSLRPTGPEAKSDGYAEAARHMDDLARGQPGFLGLETARDQDGFGITVSYWTDMGAAQSWKQHSEHLKAQHKGRHGWYHAWHVRVCQVERSYGFMGALEEADPWAPLDPEA